MRLQPVSTKLESVSTSAHWVEQPGSSLTHYLGTDGLTDDPGPADAVKLASSRSLGFIYVFLYFPLCH